MTILTPGIYGPKRGLVAYYSLDNRYISGSTAIDSTTNNNNGTISGATTGTTGQVDGQACTFDGVDDQITLPNLGFSGNTSVTVSLWHRPSESAGSQNITFGFGERGTAGAVFGLDAVNDGEVMLFFWGNNLTVSTSLYYGAWSHIAGRYDASTGERSIWFNGSEAGSDTAPTPNFQDKNYGIGSMDSANWYNGDIDEVRVYNRALSSSEISELFNEG